VELDYFGISWVVSLFIFAHDTLVALVTVRDSIRRKVGHARLLLV